MMKLFLLMLFGFLCGASLIRLSDMLRRDIPLAAKVWSYFPKLRWVYVFCLTIDILATIGVLCISALVILQEVLK